jgi:hypothetical protein
VCIYEFDQHSHNAHESTPEHCFPNSIARASLDAGTAIEDSDQKRIDWFKVDQLSQVEERINRAIFRFTTMKQIPLDRPPFSFADAIAANGDIWRRIAAVLVPRLFDSLVHATPRASEWRMELGHELNGRLEMLVRSGADLRMLKEDPAKTLVAWFEFCPRLLLLMIQYESDQRWLPFLRKIYLYLPDDFRVAIDQQLAWYAMPHTLDRVDTN